MTQLLVLARRIPATGSALIRRRWNSTYRPSDFNLASSGYVPPVKEPIVGPLADSRSKITPRALKQHLDRYVVGQDRSKRVLCTAIYHHYHRVQQLRKLEQEQQESIFRESQANPVDVFDDEDGSQKIQIEGINMPRKEEQLKKEELFNDESPLTIEKSNVLCLGPTGVGKTLMIRTLAKILDVPFSMSDCTPFTMAGYVGEDVDQAVHRLLIAANHDVRRAETGIICLDEFDKIAKPKSLQGTKDISGEGVQQALLKIVEGTTLQLHTKPEKKPPPLGVPSNPTPGTFNQAGSTGAPSPKGETITIDTSGILFIFTGAFIGLEKIVSDRLAKGSMGFNSHVQSTSSPTPSSLQQTEPSDLISFGLIPEIVGRIPVTTTVDTLSTELLVRVLTEPRNALLRQYQHLFSLSGVELAFTSPSLGEIAKAAEAMGTGARGLRTVMERLLQDAMFEAPGTSIKHVLVNAAVAAGKQPPLYFSRGQRHKFEAMMSAEEESWTKRGNVTLYEPPVEEGEQVAGFA